MTVFLTSSPCLLGEEKLNPANGFVEALRKALPSPCRCLFITSDRDNHAFTEGHGYAIKRSFEATGFSFSEYTLLDGRSEAEAAALVEKAELIVLAGGHVPTQNSFFVRIGLRELLRGFNGVIMGISAGSMNSADTVYVQPELPGESTDPDFVRFAPGLGLTKAQILPHYNQVKDNLLDGRRLFEDITFEDSFGQRFFVLNDGSYISVIDGQEYLHGEAYLIENGSMKQICANNMTVKMRDLYTAR
ncbi:MAG: Type 1 glutamine amidotransferase-like domain-containing protein [Oscillospiraceae bacterium]|nr:Type 1 glutamine amidotransferase-like domain-containing protein [Oscillospiraceae bacterium]